MSTLFKTSGLNVIASKDGKEGIAEAKRSAPSLIVLDLMMPRKGGIKMYQQLKTDMNLKNIPVIVLSGVESKTFFHSLNVLGAGSKEPLPEPDAYMEKPPNPEELLRTVQALLKQ
jgi:CheY-like chemotaxis protein